ncbi:hypothetical protein LBMAG56_27600 [Verrucomicrobiota bacterium]|nr:hypothetical protein LBMAG56_27600 [Verrucomicrobiota bacterium]
MFGTSGASGVASGAAASAAGARRGTMKSAHASQRSVVRAIHRDGENIAAMFIAAPRSGKRFGWEEAKSCGGRDALRASVAVGGRLCPARGGISRSGGGGSDGLGSIEALAR